MTDERYDEQGQEFNGATLGPIPTDDEMKGKYIGVLGVTPQPVKEAPNVGRCEQCGADYNQYDVPFSHKSVAGNLMPGHADIPTTPAKRIPLYGLSMWEVSAAEQEINPVFYKIKDLLWDKVPDTDEYNDPVSNHNTLVYVGFLRGKQASVNTIKEQVTCPICVSGDTHRSNTNEHINEPKLPEGLDQLINEFARHRPNDLQIGKDFILESFRRGRDSKIS
jgi:hypothetical protein